MSRYKTSIMDRPRKFLLSGLGLLFVGLFLYEAGRVVQAKITVKNKFSAVRIETSDYINLAKFPTEWRAILLRIEDPNFYSHKGIDMKSPGAGMTTITQALTKQLFFDKFKPGFAKVEQSLIARFAVNPAISKDTQLQAFINISYFGQCHGGAIVGFNAAAKCYYNKNFDELSTREFIQLSAMLIGPNWYNPVNGKKALHERVSRIEKMLAGKCAPKNNRDVYLSAC